MKHNVRNREHIMKHTHTYLSRQSTQIIFLGNTYGRQATLKSNDALESFSLGNPYGRKTTLKCKHALLSLFWYGKYV